MTTLSVKLLVSALTGGATFQLDFNGDLYLAGMRILHGVTPYEPGLLNHQAAIVQAGGTLVAQTYPRYPAPLLLASVPLSLLPVRLADVVFLVVSVAAILGGFRLLGVRDRRAVAVALLACPAFSGALLGNVSPLLFLGTAAVWRWRDRVVPPGAAVAAVVAGKVFLWPLAVWMIATRRSRAFAVGCVMTAGVILAAWALIDFEDFTAYPRMLLDIAEIGGGRGCSFAALLSSMGVQTAYAQLAAFTVAVALLLLACRLAREPSGERNAFGLTVIAALTACPVVWSHYLILLYVPIALLSPGVSALWFMPMLTVFCPAVSVHGYGMAAVPTLVGELVLVGLLCRPLTVGVLARYRRISVAIATAAAPS